MDYVVPPRYSAGAAWRVNNRLTLLADWSLVKYSHRVNDRFLIVDFSDPDVGRFPCLRLAYDALEHGRSWPIALNAANEIAVEAFLSGGLGFSDIPRVIERALSAADDHTGEPASLADVRAADAWARQFSAETIRTLPSSKTPGS